MGETAVPDTLTKKFKDSTLKIHEISAREQFTRDQLTACGHEGSVPIVIDPTLLPVEFQKLISNKFPAEPYIALYYIVGDDEIGKVALKLKKMLSLPIVNISSYRRFKGIDKNELFLNPGEWLNRIKHASLVCTNSFHGTALSVKFNKPFYVVNSRRKAVWSGNRTGELLSSLGLSHRILNSSDEIPEEKEEIFRKSDFRGAMEALKERQIYSLDFLKQALSL
jgi:hypothetical protein